MRLRSELLVIGGAMIAISAAIAGGSVAQAAGITPVGESTRTIISQPAPDDPIEEKIEIAIEEVNQEAQVALEELGELDTPEKFEQSQQILEHLDRAVHDLRQRVHDRVSDRFEELNDVQVTRVRVHAEAELREIGNADTPQKRERAEQVRARLEEQKALLEERWSDHRARVEQRQEERDLPKFNFRSVNGRPPEWAVANGLRERLGDLTQDQVDQAIADMERDSQAALDGLGALDTPGKVARARNIRQRLTEARQGLRQKVADRTRDQAGDVYEKHAQELRLRAEAAIRQLGELDTPEKREQARLIRAKLEEALAALRERISDGAHTVYEETLDQDAQALRRRAQAALDELGELDTPERQEKARLVRQRLEQQLQSLRVQVARRTVAAYDDGSDEESQRVRRVAEDELKRLGRLDSSEKLARAKEIRARMEGDLNRLKSDQARKLREAGDQRVDTLTDLVDSRAREFLVTGLRDARSENGRIDGTVPESLRKDRITPDRIPDRLRPDIRPDGSTSIVPRPMVVPTATPEPRRTDSDASVSSDGRTAN